MNNLPTPTPKVKPNHRDTRHTQHKPNKHNEKRASDLRRTPSLSEGLAQLKHRKVLTTLTNESQSTSENVILAQNCLRILDLDVVDGGTT